MNTRYVGTAGESEHLTGIQQQQYYSILLYTDVCMPLKFIDTWYNMYGGSQHTAVVGVVQNSRKSLRYGLRI